MEAGYIGTLTEHNLKTTFSNYAWTTTRYRYFAEQAMTEGYHDIAEQFDALADRALEHARSFYEIICGIADTSTNLLISADHELYEWAGIFHDYSATARAEGFPELADRFLEEGEEKKHNSDLLRNYHMLLESNKNCPLCQALR